MGYTEPMKKALTLAAVLMGLPLTLASRPAMAATALQQLGQEAGIDAAPLVQKMKAVRTMASAEAPLMIPRRGKDVFEGCAALDETALTVHNVKQAALLVQTCLNHAYDSDGSFSVQSRAVSLGIKITVTGSILDGNPVVLDLNSSLAARGGKLLGFPAVVDNQASIQN